MAQVKFKLFMNAKKTPFYFGLPSHTQYFFREMYYSNADGDKTVEIQPQWKWAMMNLKRRNRRQKKWKQQKLWDTIVVEWESNLLLPYRMRMFDWMKLAVARARLPTESLHAPFARYHLNCVNRFARNHGCSARFHRFIAFYGVWRRRRRRRRSRRRPRTVYTPCVLWLLVTDALRLIAIHTEAKYQQTRKLTTTAPHNRRMSEREWKR